MRTVALVLAFAGLAAAGSFMGFPYETKTADKDFLYKQEKVFELLRFIAQVDYNAEYYKISQEYKIDANFNNYKNVEAVKEFWTFYEAGMLPKSEIFSIFYEEQREEAIALFHLFFYAKDFETFYKSAAWARVHMNEGMFVYSFTVAVLHRDDCQGIILPAPYEIYPWYFVNSEVLTKFYREKMQGGIQDTKMAEYYGIHKEGDKMVVYANYSGWYTYYNHEQKLSYFTEDIGLNSYYYYFSMDYPFWMGGKDFELYQDRRGELYYYFHQQLLARYYMERLTNGLGEIPTFSWKMPFNTGYNPSMTYANGYPFPVRTNNYHQFSEETLEELMFVKDFEKEFHEYIDLGYYKSVDGKHYNFSEPEAIEYLGNYFQRNPDFFHGEYPKNFNRYYEIMARTILGASHEPFSDYFAGPSALEQFETSLRDPMFWQLYKRVIYYFIHFKQQLPYYTKSELYFPGVKVENFDVDNLVTYFDDFEFEATNALFFSKEELKSKNFDKFYVRQPRLNHKPFNVKIDVTSDKAYDAIVKIFMAPRFDSHWKKCSLAEKQYNYFELDSFMYKLTAGKNEIMRNSEDFFRVSDDKLPAGELYKLFESGKLTLDMSEAHNGFPDRLLLPKGTKGGFPMEFFVIVYPYVPAETVYGSNYEEAYYSGVGTGARYYDNKPFGYPFDRPIDEAYFYQPNMYFKQEFIYHEGTDYVYDFFKPGKYGYSKNLTPKHA